MTSIERGAFASIDWQRPWYAPYAPCGARVAGRVADAGFNVADALNAEASLLRFEDGRPLRFVPPESNPDLAYEAFIDRTAGVPTRDNLHDFFNGLVWLTHPVLKRHLNALQAAEIAQAGVGPTRGPLRDALTLFDENAALLCDLPESPFASMRQRDWRGAFVTQREGWGRARVILFGHALLEKLVHPRKPITAHAWWVPPGRDIDGREGLDAWLSPATLASKAHAPLPVLGVPGWWPPNEAPLFYEDASVFRPLRR